jgi:hypothetical protein
MARPLFMGKDFMNSLKIATKRHESTNPPRIEWVIPRWWIRYNSGPKNPARLSMSGSHAAAMQNNII